MFDLSPIQLVLVLVIALLAIGPKRLPEVGRTIGRSMREVRGAISLDGSGDGDDRQERTPARTQVAADGADDDPARPVAVGGDDLGALNETPSTEAAATDDPISETATRQSPESGPAAEDMVVRGRRERP